MKIFELNRQPIELKLGDIRKATSNDICQPSVLTLEHQVEKNKVPVVPLPVVESFKDDMHAIESGQGVAGNFPAKHAGLFTTGVTGASAAVFAVFLKDTAIGEFYFGHIKDLNDLQEQAVKYFPKTIEEKTVVKVVVMGADELIEKYASTLANVLAKLYPGSKPNTNSCILEWRVIWDTFCVTLTPEGHLPAGVFGHYPMSGADVPSTSLKGKANIDTNKDHPISAASRDQYSRSGYGSFDKTNIKEPPSITIPMSSNSPAPGFRNMHHYDSVKIEQGTSHGDNDVIYLVAGQDSGKIDTLKGEKIPMVARAEDLKGQQLELCQRGQVFSGTLPLSRAGVCAENIQSDEFVIFMLDPSDDGKTFTQYLFTHISKKIRSRAIKSAIKGFKNPSKASIVVMATNHDIITCNWPGIQEDLGESFVNAPVISWVARENNIGLILSGKIPNRPVGSYGHLPNGSSFEFLDVTLFSVDNIYIPVKSSGSSGHSAKESAIELKDVTLLPADNKVDTYIELDEQINPVSMTTGDPYEEVISFGYPEIIRNTDKPTDNVLILYYDSCDLRFFRQPLNNYREFTLDGSLRVATNSYLQMAEGMPPVFGAGPKKRNIKMTKAASLTQKRNNWIPVQMESIYSLRLIEFIINEYFKETEVTYPIIVITFLKKNGQYTHFKISPLFLEHTLGGNRITGFGKITGINKLSVFEKDDPDFAGQTSEILVICHQDSHELISEVNKNYREDIIRNFKEAAFLKARVGPPAVFWFTAPCVNFCFSVSEQEIAWGLDWRFLQQSIILSKQQQPQENIAIVIGNKRGYDFAADALKVIGPTRNFDLPFGNYSVCVDAEDTEPHSIFKNLLKEIPSVESETENGCLTIVNVNKFDRNGKNGGSLAGDLGKDSALVIIIQPSRHRFDPSQGRLAAVDFEHVLVFHTTKTALLSHPDIKNQILSFVTLPEICYALLVTPDDAGQQTKTSIKLLKGLFDKVNTILKDAGRATISNNRATIFLPPYLKFCMTLTCALVKKRAVVGTFGVWPMTAEKGDHDKCSVM